MALAPTRTVLSSIPTTSTTSTLFLASTPSSSSSSSWHNNQQLRHATFVPRPRRPYTFTQLVTLSDGSAFTLRTTSPQPLYRSSKDTRNTLLWQPSEKSLRNVELDEAGRLAAFRSRFGRGFDAATSQSSTSEGGAAGGAAAAAEGGAATSGEEAGEGEGEDGAMSEDSLADLITGYAPQDTSALKGSLEKKIAGRRK
jgi:hypothetical protein